MENATEEKPFLWSDLKEFVNSLSEEQLKKEVIWWGEERAGAISSAVELEEDHVDDGDVGVMPRSIFEETCDPEDELIVRYEKGTAILQTDGM